MTVQDPRASMEELACLLGGPARAAEVALARLLDVDLIRISDDGLMTAHHRPGLGAMTPLQLHILNDVQAGGRHLHEVAWDAAESPWAAELHTRVIERGLLRAERDRRHRLWPWLGLIGLGLVVMTFVDVRNWEYFAGGMAVVIWAWVLMWRDPGRLMTKAGRKAVDLAGPSVRHDRVVAVAFHGLRGRVGVFSVAKMFCLTPEVVRTLPERPRGSGSAAAAEVRDA